MKLHPKLLITTGYTFTLIGLVIFGFTYFPIIREEFLYGIRSHMPKNEEAVKPLTPIDEEFGIVIPKLGANAHIIANVDPYSEKDYQYALTRGVAHARGTSYPGTSGNIFLFSHSSVNFYEATQYNSIFYLINKLEDGDEILLYYKKNKYTYKVTDKKLVDPKDTSYLTQKTGKKMVTLMTCWPPGTAVKRLLVVAEITP
jgi:LPXTG-site transpeptidase (sortase) family protein